MKLTVLVDNNTYIDNYYLGEPALSYYIEDQKERILFDVGYSDVFIRNAQAMNLDLSAVSTIVLSHGHNDHTGGLNYLLEQYPLSHYKIVAHPDVFRKRIEEGKHIGAPVRKEQMEKVARMNLSKEPVKMSEHITFLGEIPVMFDFEPRKGMGIFEDDQEQVDCVMDDSAIVYQREDGLFIITGCSHSGICNIIEYAKKVCNQENIIGIIGGFHLFEPNKQLEETIHYFRQNKIQVLYPCHCVSFNAKAEIHKAIPCREVGVGLEIEI